METDATLRQLQMTELGILKDVAEFCEAHRLTYSLYAGTLLGAVRHKGFIPWDDDIDICMPREDYNRFLALWKTGPLKGYVLQNHDNTPAFAQTFTKIRKDHTAIVTDIEEETRYHSGIFVDIFPVDRIPVGKLQRYLYWFRCAEYQLMLHGRIPTDERGNAVVKAVCRVLLALYSGKRRVKKQKSLLRQLTKYNGNRKLPLVLAESTVSMRKIYPAHLFDEMCYLPFEDREYMCFKDWDAKLSGDFGDYMTLPPEEKRRPPHRPAVLSFDKTYEELMQEKK